VNFTEDQSKDLIIRYLTGDLSPDDTLLLQEWLGQNPENQLFFLEHVQAWRLSGSISHGSGNDTQDALATLRKRIENAAPQQPVVQKKRMLTVGTALLKYAAVFILVFVLGGVSAFFVFRARSAEMLHPRAYQVVTPNGTRSEITLADGTRVWLNAGSTLSYTENYNVKRRQVDLSGEAYFSVAKDKTRPFVVKSGGLEIRALGTAFNVKAYPSENQLTATLVEGSIKVEGRSRTGRFSYTLQPSQNITLLTSEKPERRNKNLQRVTPEPLPEKREIRNIEKVVVENNVNTMLYTSWKDRRWVIEQQQFASFALMLERRYSVNIAYNPDEMKGISFTGTIENETLEQVIHIMQLSAPLKYKFGKGEVEISLDKSQVAKFKRLMQ
jgi:ferric-dicitrate binding protein FerR (iron transport regulator)